MWIMFVLLVVFGLGVSVRFSVCLVRVLFLVIDSMV